MISRVLGITLVAAGLILAAVGTGAFTSSDEAVTAQKEYKASCSKPAAELVQVAQAEKSSCGWSEAKATKVADGKSCTYEKAQKTADSHVVMTGAEKVAKGYACSEEKAVKTADAEKSCSYEGKAVKTADASKDCSYEGKAVKTAGKSCESSCDKPCEEKAVKTAAEKKDCSTSCDKAKPATDKAAPSEQPEKVASEEESTKVSLAK